MRPTIPDLLTRDARRDKILADVAAWGRVLAAVGTKEWSRDISKSFIPIEKPEDVPVDITILDLGAEAVFDFTDVPFICTLNPATMELGVFCLDDEYSSVTASLYMFESEWNALSMAVDCYMKLERSLMLPVRVYLLKTNPGVSGEKNSKIMASIIAYVNF